MKRLRIAAHALAVACLVACWNDGGGGNDFPSYPPTAADSMLLPFVTAAGELKLLDPATPDAEPVIAETGIGPFAGMPSRLVAGSYDAATDTVVGVHGRFISYVKGGTLFRVDLLNTAGHEPTQFSSISDACFTRQFVDFNNPLNSRFIVRVAGDDAACNNLDDEARLVTLGAPASDPGVAVPRSFGDTTTILAPDGSLQRLLLHDLVSDEFTSYAPDFSSSKLLANAPVEFAASASRTQKYFLVFPTAGGLEIHRYDAAGDSLTHIHTYATWYGFAVADAGFLYFDDGQDIFRVAHGSTTKQPLHALEAGVSVWNGYQSENRLVLVLEHAGSGAFSLESLPKTDGAARAVLEAASETRPELISTGGTKVYYNRGTAGSSRSATRVDEAGLGRIVVDKGQWKFTVFSESSSRQRLPASRTLMLVVKDAGVSTLRGVDTSTGIVGPMLGRIDDLDVGHSRAGGRYALISAQVDGNDATSDVYFVDIPTARSLRAVATAPGPDRVP